MRTTSLIMLAICAVGIPKDGIAQTNKPDPGRTASLETRLVRDSSGCPSAIDLWLVSTSDTIQGFEAVLQWDRPNQVEFTRGVSAAAKKPSATDSLNALLKPSDPKTQVRVDRHGSIISGWEFVEARSLDGNTAKVLGVAKLFGQEEPEPILPGKSGLLLRIPFSKLSSGLPSDSAMATLNFDPAGTRLSTHRGALFGKVSLNSTPVDLRGCAEPGQKH